MNIKVSANHRRRLQSGFSLVEVALATGITAMAMTTLLGMIPHGLSNIREAGNISAESRITENVIGTVSQARWEDSQGGDILGPEFDQQRFYFDDQGMRLEESKVDGANLSYVAELRVPPPDVELSSSGPANMGGARDPYLRRVTVNVTRVPNKEFNFDSAPKVSYRSQSTLIARAGR